MTEAEANERWCPFVCEGTLSPFAKSNQAQGRCIGSRCMAWRQDGEQQQQPTRVHPNVLKNYWKDWTVTDDKPDDRGYVEISPPAIPPSGYCGLAGKP